MYESGNSYTIANINKFYAKILRFHENWLILAGQSWNLGQLLYSPDHICSYVFPASNKSCFVFVSSSSESSLTTVTNFIMVPTEKRGCSSQWVLQIHWKINITTCLWMYVLDILHIKIVHTWWINMVRKQDMSNNNCSHHHRLIIINKWILQHNID